jgi:hypothetical protein
LTLIAQIAPGHAFLRSGSGNVMLPPTIVKKLGLSNERRWKLFLRQPERPVGLLLPGLTFGMCA